MSSIPLKNNTGTIVLYENGNIEIKRLSIISLIAKNSINRINIYNDGRVVLYQINANYSTDLEFHVDRVNIVGVQELFTAYMTHANDNTAELYIKLKKLQTQMDKIANIQPELNTSIEIMNDYKSSIKLVNEHIMLICEHNTNNNEKINSKFLELNKSVNDIKSKVDTINLNETSPIIYEEIESLENAIETIKTTTCFQMNTCLNVSIIIFICLLMYYLVTHFMMNPNIFPDFIPTSFPRVLIDETERYPCCIISKYNDTLEGF
jgi:hypothetical protein